MHSLIFFDLFCVLLAASWILVYLLCNVLLSSFNSIYPAHKKVRQAVRAAHKRQMHIMSPRPRLCVTLPSERRGAQCSAVR